MLFRSASRRRVSITMLYRKTGGGMDEGRARRIAAIGPAERQLEAAVQPKH